jgi:hypothetical protein
MFRRQHTVLVQIVISVLLDSLLTSLGLARLSDATLKGTVTDVTGAVVPHALVIATNESTEQVRSTTSDGRGVMSHSSLPSGTYTVRVSAPGFKIFEERGLELKVGKLTETIVRLELGEAKQTVQASAKAAEVPVVTRTRPTAQTWTMRACCQASSRSTPATFTSSWRARKIGCM